MQFSTKIYEQLKQNSDFKNVRWSPNRLGVSFKFRNTPNRYIIEEVGIPRVYYLRKGSKQIGFVSKIDFKVTDLVSKIENKL